MPAPERRSSAPGHAPGPDRAALGPVPTASSKALPGFAGGLWRRPQCPSWRRARQGLAPSGADVACPHPGWTRSRPPRRRRQPPGKKTYSTGVRNRGKVCLAKADLRFEHGFPPGSAIRQRDPRGASQAERSLTELARAPDALPEDQTIMRSRPRIITGVRPELDRGQTPARPAK